MQEWLRATEKIPVSFMIILSNGIAHERMAWSDCKNASWSGTFAMSFISLVTKTKFVNEKCAGYK